MKFLSSMPRRVAQKFGTLQTLLMQLNTHLCAFVIVLEEMLVALKARWKLRIVQEESSTKRSRFIEGKTCSTNFCAEYIAVSGAK